MKRVIALLAAAALSITVLCGMTSVPESVEARTDGEKTEIVKVYRLAPEEDPSLLIEEPFEQEGYLYEYESMVKEEEIQEQSKVAETSLTVETETDELAEIIKELPGSVPYSGTDGYSGKLILNPGSITTEAAGYATSSFTVSDTRVYTDLAYNDNSLIPQTVTKNGMTLTLSNVSWQGQGGTGANGSLIPTAYTATAYYSAVGSRRYATGYVTTASYSRDVVLTSSEIIYTVTYTGTLIPPEPAGWPDWIWIAIGGGTALLACAAFAALYIREVRKSRRQPQEDSPEAPEKEQLEEKKEEMEDEK